MVKFLDANVRKITICARSKRWWNKEIKGKRKELGKAKRRLRRCRREGLDSGGRREEEEAVREAGRALRNEIRKAKRKTWEEFLHKADGNNVWSVITYTKPQRGTSVPTITHNGATASTLEEKADMLLGISFPTPNPYEGGEGTPGPPHLQKKISLGGFCRVAFHSTGSTVSMGSATTRRNPCLLGELGDYTVKSLFARWAR